MNMIDENDISALMIGLGVELLNAASEITGQPYYIGYNSKRDRAFVKMYNMKFTAVGETAIIDAMRDCLLWVVNNNKDFVQWRDEIVNALNKNDNETN